MAGFVKKVISRRAALEEIKKELGFPWDMKNAELPLSESIGKRCAEDIVCPAPYPPFDRSLRDGYAVRHEDANGATPGTPLFLTQKGDVAMGEVPKFKISAFEAAAIPTGGIMPEGADAVVMLEDTDSTGGWIEIRRGVQAKENIIMRGEELAVGQLLLKKGALIDFKNIGMLSTVGMTRVPVLSPKISILSTGDEIVPVETSDVPPGCIRDVNGWNIKALLHRWGFEAQYKGIASDEGGEFEKRFHDELAECDILILSGGSSVGVRDHCSQLLEKLPEPGLIMRGLNIVPGKPTLAAGDRAGKKVVVSLPGHPLSCLTVAFVFLLPLLSEMTVGGGFTCGLHTRLPLSQDLAAHTGPEEFVPCAVGPDGRVTPITAKSGYISALSKACGLICIPEDKETLRAGEETEVWLWL